MDVFRSLRTDDCATFLSLVGCQLDMTGDLGRSFLHEAIAHGKVDTSFALIDRGVRIDARDDLGRTALHYAAMFGQTDIVNRLINANFDVNAADEYGNNPLWTAILNPKIDYEIIRSLVRRGSSITATNRTGKSAAMMAEIIGDEEILKILADGV